MRKQLPFIVMLAITTVGVITLTLAGRRAAAQTALEGSLISYWQLDESSGVRYDAHGSNDLTDNNTVGVTTTGIISNAAAFVHTNNEYLSHASNEDLFTGDINFSISAWFYITDTTTPRLIAAKRSGALGAWVLYYAGTDEVSFDVYDGVSVVGSVLSSSSLTETTWYHVVAWHDADNNEVGVVIDNGTPVTSTTSGAVSDSSEVPFTISNSAGYWAGYIDEFGFWKRLLTDSEICALYNSGSGLAYPFYGEIPGCSYSEPTPTPTSTPTDTPTPTNTPTPTPLFSPLPTPPISPLPTPDWNPWPPPPDPQQSLDTCDNGANLFINANFESGKFPWACAWPDYDNPYIEEVFDHYGYIVTAYDSNVSLGGLDSHQGAARTESWTRSTIAGCPVFGQHVKNLIPGTYQVSYDLAIDAWGDSIPSLASVGATILRPGPCAGGYCSGWSQKTVQEIDHSGATWARITDTITLEPFSGLGQNLLDNGDFESGATAWSGQYNITAGGIETYTVPYGGGHAAQTFHWMQPMYQDFSWGGGDLYLSAYGVSVDGGRFTVKVENLGSGETKYLCNWCRHDRAAEVATIWSDAPISIYRFWMLAESGEAHFDAAWASDGDNYAMTKYGYFVGVQNLHVQRPLAAFPDLHRVDDNLDEISLMYLDNARLCLIEAEPQPWTPWGVRDEDGELIGEPTVGPSPTPPPTGTPGNPLWDPYFYSPRDWLSSSGVWWEVVEGVYVAHLQPGSYIERRFNYFSDWYKLGVVVQNESGATGDLLFGLYDEEGRIIVEHALPEILHYDPPIWTEVDTGFYIKQDSTHIARITNRSETQVELSIGTISMASALLGDPPTETPEPTPMACDIGQDLIVNGDFEYGLWSWDVESGVPIFETGGICPATSSGQYLRFSNQQGVGDGTGVVYQRFYWSGGGTLYAFAAAYGDQTILSLRNEDTSMTYYDYHFEREWAALEVVYPSPPSGWYQVRLSGLVALELHYFDHVRVRAEQMGYPCCVNVDVTLTPGPTGTSTGTPTETASPTATSDPPTPSSTPTSTPTPTGTSTRTPTPSQTSQPTQLPSPTGAPPPTNTPPPEPTSTSIPPTSPPTPTNTPGPTPTRQGTSTPTNTPDAGTPTATPLLNTPSPYNPCMWDKHIFSASEWTSSGGVVWNTYVQLDIYGNQHTYYYASIPQNDYIEKSFAFNSTRWYKLEVAAIEADVGTLRLDMYRNGSLVSQDLLTGDYSYIKRVSIYLEAGTYTARLVNTGSPTAHVYHVCWNYSSGTPPPPTPGTGTPGATATSQFLPTGTPWPTAQPTTGAWQGPVGTPISGPEPPDQAGFCDGPRPTLPPDDGMCGTFEWEVPAVSADVNIVVRVLTNIWNWMTMALSWVGYQLCLLWNLIPRITKWLSWVIQWVMCTPLDVLYWLWCLINLLVDIFLNLWCWLAHRWDFFVGLWNGFWGGEYEISP